MTVQELIDKLQEIENKNLPVMMVIISTYNSYDEIVGVQATTTDDNKPIIGLY